jgi:hypothetical protein
LLVAVRQRVDGWVERRDVRHQVLLRARMKVHGPAVEICIRNISARGACIVTACPPPRGTIVEIGGCGAPIVGRIVWSSERRAGIEIRGRLNVQALLGNRTDSDLFESVAKPGHYSAPVARLPHKSRDAGNLIQYGFALMLVAAAAIGIGTTVHGSLAKAANPVAAALDIE